MVAIGAASVVAAVVALAGFKLNGGETAPPEVLPNSVVRIDPETLKPTDVVPIGDAPDLVVLAGGFAWVTHHILRDTEGEGLRNAGDRTLTRVDLSTREPQVVGGGLAPCGIAADPSGDVWVANCYPAGSGARPNVVRIDARTLNFEAGPWPVPAAADTFRGLVYGGGSLWLSAIAQPHDAATPEAVAKINPRTGRWHSIPLPWPPRPLAWSDGYGDLWLSNFAVGSVSRLHITTDGVDTKHAVATNPGALVVDGDTVWVADWSGPRVVRLRAVGRTRTRSVYLPVKNLAEAGVSYIAAGAGAIWAATPHDRTLWRIDAKTNKVTPIHMPHDPWGVAADDHDVWVTVRAE